MRLDCSSASFFNKSGPTVLVMRNNEVLFEILKDLTYVMPYWMILTPKHQKNLKIWENFEKSYANCSKLKSVRIFFLYNIIYIKFSWIPDQAQQFSSICVEMATMKWSKEKVVGKKILKCETCNIYLLWVGGLNFLDGGTFFACSKT